MLISKLKQQDGVTLLEVLVAMFIMGFSLILLLNMAMLALDGNDWSNKTTVAAQMLQEKLEHIRATADFTAGTDNDQGITRSWTSTDIGSHLRRVDVQVQWQDFKANTKSNTLTAFVRVN